MYRCFDIKQTELQKASTVEGSLFRHKIIVFPSNFAMYHAHIRQDPLVSHVETTFRHM